jgi:hydrogenase expression/formation protein HypD
MISHNNPNQQELLQKLVELIERSASEETRIMLASGIHTASALMNGTYDLLPPNIILTTGPGCAESAPTTREIDKALTLCREKDAIVTTPADFLHVPGSSSSLAIEKKNGADVRTVDSALQAQRIAADNADKKVIFIGTGFEADASGTASAILEARRQGTKNFRILSLHRMIAPALEAMLSDGESEIDGILCPGHISAVIGSNAYLPVVMEHRIPCVISGFSKMDVVHSIYMLLRQLGKGRAGVQTQLKSAVTIGGNRNALAAMERVFRPADVSWRGLGMIPKSGLMLRLEYRAFQAENNFDLPTEHEAEPSNCVCGDVITGKSNPLGCPLFDGDCTPEHPVGPAMASANGPCSAFHQYAAKEADNPTRSAA